MTTPSIAVLAALSLALAAPLVPALAQTPSPATPVHGQHGGGRLKKMAEALGLTDAQKAQMKPILISARQQAQAIKGDTSLSDDARKSKLRELHKTTRMQTMAILTPAQRDKLKAMNQAKRAAKNGA